MTATDASRAFEALLDEVETGETIIVTRGGKRVARIEPASAGNGAEVIALLSSIKVDPYFAANVRAAREVVTPGEPVWPVN